MPHRPVAAGPAEAPLDDFLTELEASRATFKHNLEYLRDRLHAPIEWNRETGGCRYAQHTA